MRGFTTIFSLLIGTLASASVPPKIESHFENLRGCFLLYNLKAKKLEAVYGEENCKMRLTACSTFKIPLALMAIDSGVIDENSKFKWDGSKNEIGSWNQDQTTPTWMKYSVVWVSQQITPKLGAKKINDYLQKFRYGNKDMSGGIYESWLTKKGTLKISAFEQLEFMLEFWQELLPVKKKAFETTKNIAFIEKSPNGFELHGKTGSGFLGHDDSRRIGWFVSHIGGNGKDYIAITSITDKVSPKEKSYGGMQAREITKAILKDYGLWN